MPDPTPTDLTDKIIAATSAAKSVTVDGMTSQKASVAEIIAADQYLRRRSAAARPGFGRRLKFISPGAV